MYMYTHHSFLPYITMKCFQTPFHKISQNPLLSLLLTSHPFPILRIFHYFLLIHNTSPKNSLYPQNVPSTFFLLPKSDSLPRTLVSSAAISRGDSFSSYSSWRTGPGIGVGVLFVLLCCFQTTVPSIHP